MAERKSSRSGGRGGSGSGSSGKSGSGSSGKSRSDAQKSSSRASSKRTPTATSKETPSERSPTGGDENGSRGSEGGGMSKAEEAQTGGKEMGRPPADEPDVYVYVPEVHVGELNIDVERLEAHLALRAQVANLVNLVAGVHVGVDAVKIDLKDVNAECELKVRLENTYNILDRTLSTLDENPEIVKGLLETADTTVQETGQIGKEATKPGGAVSELSSGVGDTLGNIAGSLSDTLSSVSDKASPKRLTSGSSGGSAKKSGGNSGGSGPAKGAAAAGAAGAAGLVGGALLGWRRRRGLSGLFRRNGLHSIAKQIGNTRKEIRKARKTADRVLP